MSLIAAVAITSSMNTIPFFPFNALAHIMQTNDFWMEVVSYGAFIYVIQEMLAIVNRLPIERDKIAEMAFDMWTAFVPPLALVVAFALALERGYDYDPLRWEIIQWWGLASIVDIYIGVKLMLVLSKYASPLETSTQPR